MTREQAINQHYDIKCNIVEARKIEALINKIYDDIDFENELKIEKDLQEKEQLADYWKLVQDGLR